MTRVGLSRFAHRTSTMSQPSSTQVNDEEAEEGGTPAPDQGDDLLASSSFDDASLQTSFLDDDIFGMPPPGEVDENSPSGVYPEDAWMHDVDDNSTKTDEERGNGKEAPPNESTALFGRGRIFGRALAKPNESIFARVAASAANSTVNSVNSSNSAAATAATLRPATTLPAPTVRLPIANGQKPQASGGVSIDSTTAPLPVDEAPPNRSVRFGPKPPLPLPSGADMTPTLEMNPPKTGPSNFGTTGPNGTFTSAPVEQGKQDRAIRASDCPVELAGTNTYGGPSSSDLKTPQPTTVRIHRDMPAPSSSGIIKTPGSFLGRLNGAATTEHPHNTHPPVPMVTPGTAGSHKKVTFAAGIQLTSNVTNITPESNRTGNGPSQSPPSLQTQVQTTTKDAPTPRPAVPITTAAANPPNPPVLPPEPNFDDVHQAFEHHCRDIKDNVKQLVDDILDGSVHLHTHQAEVQLLQAEMVDVTDQLESNTEELEEILNEFSTLFPEDA